MEISPKVAIWINVVLALLNLVGSGGLALTGIVSPAQATQIATGAASLQLVISTVMHAYSNSTPGPLAPPDAPVVVAAQKVADLPPSAGPAVIAQTKKVAAEAITDHQP